MGKQTFDIYFHVLSSSSAIHCQILKEAKTKLRKKCGLTSTRQRKEQKKERVQESPRNLLSSISKSNNSRVASSWLLHIDNKIRTDPTFLK